MKLAIIVSEFNEEINNNLLNGAKTFLSEVNIDIDDNDIFRAPGAFEIPLIAKKLAKKDLYAGIICLGTVIKGETAHFEFISLAASVGMMQVGLEVEKPIAFGLLTVYNREQAVSRSLEDAANKGIEAARACYKSVTCLAAL